MNYLFSVPTELSINFHFHYIRQIAFLLVLHYSHPNPRDRNESVKVRKIQKKRKEEWNISLKKIHYPEEILDMQICDLKLYADCT